ncbi:MAG: hypothetical protein Q4D38_02540 [Planctomycetia bacterium]|nr:hypothetical protein [Planctomycetia bacterium]
MGSSSSATSWRKRRSASVSDVGIGVESLGGLKFAAEQCGANFDVLTDALKTFQNRIGAAQSGGSCMIEKLQRVGVDAEAFKGLNNEEQLMKLADHIQAIGNQSGQTRDGRKNQART